MECPDIWERTTDQPFLSFFCPNGGTLYHGQQILYSSAVKIKGRKMEICLLHNSYRHHKQKWFLCLDMTRWKQTADGLGRNCLELNRCVELEWSGWLCWVIQSKSEFLESTYHLPFTGLVIKWSFDTFSSFDYPGEGQHLFIIRHRFNQRVS